MTKTILVAAILKFCQFKKTLKDDRWHPLDSYYLWSQEPESIIKHCIYSESHLTKLAAGLIFDVSFKR